MWLIKSVVNRKVYPNLLLNSFIGYTMALLRLSVMNCAKDIQAFGSWNISETTLYSSRLSIQSYVAGIALTEFSLSRCRSRRLSRRIHPPALASVATTSTFQGVSFKTVAPPCKIPRKKPFSRGCTTSIVNGFRGQTLPYPSWPKL